MMQQLLAGLSQRSTACGPRGVQVGRCLNSNMRHFNIRYDRGALVLEDGQDSSMEHICFLHSSHIKAFVNSGRGRHAKTIFLPPTLQPANYLVDCTQMLASSRSDLFQKPLRIYTFLQFRIESGGQVMKKCHCEMLSCARSECLRCH